GRVQAADPVRNRGQGQERHQAAQDAPRTLNPHCSLFHSHHAAVVRNPYLLTDYKFVRAWLTKQPFKLILESNIGHFLLVMYHLAV
ncbi:jg9152, partial [Pararge aegeria aegeria]